MAAKKTTFETGGVYRCAQDTHLIDYKLIKKKSRYRLVQRAVRIREGDIVTCLDTNEDSSGRIEAIFILGGEIIHIQEHTSTLRALQKMLIKVDHK